MPYDPLEDTLDSTNSLGSIITFSGGMDNSSTDIEGNQPNTQRGSEYSSGIDTASSGQLESASFTSEILLANRVNSSAGSTGSSDIRVVRLLNFDTLADAADALALVAARSTAAQGTITTRPGGSPATGRFTITTTTTTDHTVNEEDVRRKRTRPPETTTTTNPFTLAAPAPLAVRWPASPPALPPPVIVPRGVSTVPYSQLEAVNNRLNKICGERDSMKEELRTRTVEIQKFRNNNRVLLGENLLLKQQQAQLLEIMDKKTVVIQVLKRHMELLEMINNSTNKKNKNTKDTGTTVDAKDTIKLKTTDSQTTDEEFDQMRQNRTDTRVGDDTEDEAFDQKRQRRTNTQVGDDDLSACDAVVDEVIQRCSSASVDLTTDTRTQAMTKMPDEPNSTELPQHVTDHVARDVTKEYAQEIVNKIMTEVLQDIAGEDTEIGTLDQNKPDVLVRTDSEIVQENIDNKAEELVNNVIEKAVIHLSKEYRQSEIAAIDSEIEEEKPDAPREKRSLDVLLKIPSQDKNNPQRCPACEYALSEGTLRESLSDPLLFSNEEKMSERSPSREIYTATESSTNIDGDSVGRFHPTWSEKIFLDFIGGDGKTGDNEAMMMITPPSTSSTSEASADKADCEADVDEPAPGRPSVCDVCTQTQEEDDELSPPPSQSPDRPGSRFRTFICCTRQ